MGKLLFNCRPQPHLYVIGISISCKFGSLSWAFAMSERSSVFFFLLFSSLSSFASAFFTGSKVIHFFIDIGMQ